MSKPLAIIFLYIFTSFSLFAEVVDVSNKKDTAPQALLQLNVVDVQETWLEDRKTLSVSFSQKLDKNIPYDGFVTVTEDGISLKGEWIQSENPTCLYLTNIKPEKKYEIFIRPGMKSANGLKLLTPKHFDVTTEAISSEINLLENKQNISPNNFSALHIRSSDIKKQDISLYRLNDEKHKQFIQKLQTTANPSNWDISDIVEISDVILQKSITIDNGENKRTLSTVQLDENAKMGLYFASIEAQTVGGETLNQLSYFSVSNLDLVTTDKPNHTSLVTISKNTGSLLANTALQLVTPKTVIEKNSNKAGRVSLTNKELAQVSWIRLAGKQTTSTNKQTDLGYLFHKNTPKSQENNQTKATAAKIFLNKQYYKRGEKLSFSVLLRDKSNKALAKKQVTISLETPYGESVDKKSMTTSDLGDVSGYFQLPDTEMTSATSDTGMKSPWQINVYLEESTKDVLSSSAFHIGKSDYLDSKITIDTNSSVINQKEKTSLDVKAFIDKDISAENVPVELNRSITWLQSPSPKYKDYNFGLKTDMELEGTEKLQLIKLDKHGQAKLVLPKIKSKIHSALSINLQAEIKIDDMPIAKQSKTLNYWPSDSMIGVHVDTNSASPDFNTQIDIININQADERLAAENLQIKLVKLNNANEWVYSRETWTWHQEESHKEDIIEEKSLSLIEADIGKLQLSLPHGNYRVDIENPDSGLITQHEFTVGDVQQVSKLTSPNQLSLSLDKESYLKDETAVLNIESLTSGEAIVQLTAESKTLWDKKVTLEEGKTQIEIPLNSSTLTQKELQIKVLGFHNQKQQYFRSEGQINIQIDKPKATLELSIIKEDQSLIIHSDDYKNKAAVISIEREKQKGEIFSPKITSLTQSLRFDENGDARMNNSDGKVNTNHNYSADLFFADQAVNGLKIRFAP